jgi:acyl carrier protein
MGLNESFSVEINRELFPVKVITFIVSLLRTVAAATYYISKLRQNQNFAKSMYLR